MLWKKKFKQNLINRVSSLKTGLFTNFYKAIENRSYLFYLNRMAVSKAVFIGLFWSFIPIPAQTIPSALTAVLFRANLPLSIVLVWVTNPITMVPIFLANYWVGVFILDHIFGNSGISVSINYLIHKIFSGNIFSADSLHLLKLIQKPLFIGSFVVASVSGLVGFIVTNIAWKLYVLNHYAKKKAKRKNK